VFVNNDPEMVDAQGQHAKARNTNLNEDLGKVRFRSSHSESALVDAVEVKADVALAIMPSRAAPTSMRTWARCVADTVHLSIYRAHIALDTERSSRHCREQHSQL
jgi:hypothetical protein